MYKSVLLVCSQALLIQSIASQCIGAGLAAPYAAAPWAASPWAAAAPWEASVIAAPISTPCAAGPWEAVAIGPYGAYGPAVFAASNGGGLGVSSASPIPVSGLSIVSENTIEGFLSVTGAVPFLGTVALEGNLPTQGAGAVNYGCGNGAIGMVSEDIAPAITAPVTYGPYGYGPSPIPDAHLYDPYRPVAGPYSRAGCGCGAII